MTQTDKHALDGMICFDIYATHHALTALYKSLLAPLKLTYPQYLVMLILWQRDGLSVGDIGAQLGLETSTLTPLLKRMERANLLNRTRDPNDERRMQITLTPEGHTLKAQANCIPACVMDATGLTLDETVVLQKTLVKTRLALAKAE